MGHIEIRNMYKDYIPGFHAVTDFNLIIEEGEFIVLVGPSGCGKSTTLRMIAGLEDITAGQLLIDGVLVNDEHPKDRDIAMVFQNYALYPHMTVRENIGFGLKLKKLSKADVESSVNETAKTIALEDYLDRLPKELSGGQKQRVALGRAIARKPKVFLMDEPLSNLDAKLRVQTRAEISQLSKKLGTTTIYVTHDQVEAMTMADRIVVMESGRIQQVGSPKEVYLKPKNKFVAGFMGSPAMNFSKVKISNRGLEKNESLMEIPEFIIKFLKEKEYLDKEVIFGIRPENIYLYEDASDSIKNYSFDTKVNVAEMLGSETLIHFNLFEDPFVSKVITLKDFAMDEDIKLCFDLDFAHFFDLDTEERIDIPGHGIYNNLLASKKVGEN